ncbi:type IV pilin protein [Acinetobacter indicus]|uniref:type IV pilin protein n=1 Tax=Acinetobacter indicus TaxID=756892 RepID=UPI00144470DE|nr:prepilin-type N-terminal cleavage/methylation domain-containing protein [Acinetobacter indicus]
MKQNNGFTLIELMMVVVVIAIVSAIAYPNYRNYVERKDLKNAQQEVLRLSAELERFKNKNFSYKNFSAKHLYSDYDEAAGELYLPVGSTASSALYKITLVDQKEKKPLTDASVLGQNWVMKAERIAIGSTLKQPKNYDLLLSSTGMRCMTKTGNAVATFTDCGDDYETW